VPRLADSASRRARTSRRAAASLKSAPPSAPAPASRAPAEGEEVFVTLAKIVRVRGRIGEVAATILTDFPARLTKLREALLLDSSGRRRSARIRRCWLASSHGGQAIFHFEGVDSINDARKFVGCEVQIPLAQRAPLPAGRFFISDLIGCEVFECIAGLSPAPLGFVRDVHLESGTPLLAVSTPTGGELLIPFADEICTRIDPAARRIEVRLPPGLRELNP
jgi:16S rRNA processing protein RimM